MSHVAVVVKFERLGGRDEWRSIVALVYLDSQFNSNASYRRPRFRVASSAQHTSCKNWPSHQQETPVERAVRYSTADNIVI